MLDGAKFCKCFLLRLCLAKNKKIGDLSELQRGQISIWTQSGNIGLKIPELVKARSDKFFPRI